MISVQKISDRLPSALCFIEVAAAGLGDGMKNVERAGADIAVDDAERGEDSDRLELLGALHRTLLYVCDRAQ